MDTEILAFSRTAAAGLLSMAPLAVLVAVIAAWWFRGRRLP